MDYLKEILTKTNMSSGKPVKKVKPKVTLANAKDVGTVSSLVQQSIQTKRDRVESNKIGIISQLH